jgi:hypothetical protein
MRIRILGKNQQERSQQNSVARSDMEHWLVEELRGEDELAPHVFVPHSL